MLKQQIQKLKDRIPEEHHEFMKQVAKEAAVALAASMLIGFVRSAGGGAGLLTAAALSKIVKR